MGYTISPLQNISLARFLLWSRERRQPPAYCALTTALDMPVPMVSPSLLVHPGDRIPQPAPAGSVWQTDSPGMPGWQPWDARLYPCALNKTQDSPNQDQEIWMHLWSYLNLCGSRGISSVRGIQKLCGSVSLLSLSFAPFTQNQMHTHYAHTWNTTQRILRQELFPVLGFTLALFLYFVQFFGDLQFL